MLIGALDRNSLARALLGPYIYMRNISEALDWDLRAVFTTT